MQYVIAVAISAAVLLSGCGGGGGSSRAPAPPPTSNPPPDNPDPFGLTQRVALASFSLPQQGTGSGSYDITAAFPGLSFSAPLLAAVVPGENRLVVVEQEGRIHAFDNNPNASSSRIVFDHTSQVLFAGEQGLLGLAFDPAFTTNRYVYVHYSAANPPGTTNPARSVIARFTWDAGADFVDASTEKVILEVAQPFANHNGGMLAFGPDDDYLYIALGDGGSGGDPDNNSQNRGNLLGKVLRIDVHPQNVNDPYDIPADNPFVGVAGVREEIWAWGLRNPFRFSFDRQNGDLWLGDVGQNAIEEINIITRGGNYGWRVFEGTQPFDNSANTLPNSAFTPPVYEYPHADGRSVTGGYVYRGSQIASLFGHYIYGDFVANRIWALDWNGSQVTERIDLGSVSSPAGFFATDDGELLVVSYNNGPMRIEETSGGSGQIPTELSATGLFTDLATLSPANGLIEYAVNHPFFSDYTEKRRWVGLPDSAQIAFSAADWTLPTGSVAVKHFEINLTEDDPDTAQRLETRVLINTDQGWLGFTYRWNNAATDATLLADAATENLTVTLSDGSTRNQVYEYPSRSDCLGCHTQVAGFTLGLQTPQLNGDFDYSGTIDNQLRSFNNISLFDTDIGEADQYTAYPAPAESGSSVAARARTYLAVNCSQCHQPGGPTTTDLDLRAGTAEASMNALNQPAQTGDLGITNARIIATGEKERSVLWERMRRLDDNRMPPLASHTVDAEGLVLIGQWIDEL